MLQGLQRDIASQQREQEIQASALREALLDLQQQQTEGQMWASELAEVRNRCGKLMEEISRIKDERSAIETRLETEMAAKLRHQEQRFALLVKAMEMERSARIKETAELRSMGAAAAECAEAINLERSARTSEAGELRTLVTAAVELAEVTATELRMPLGPSFCLAPTARAGSRSLASPSRSPSRPQRSALSPNRQQRCNLSPGRQQRCTENDTEFRSGHCRVRRRSGSRSADAIVHVSCVKHQIADAASGRPTSLDNDDGDGEIGRAHV